MFFFAIPALNPQVAQDEFNRFCATQRVVTVDRQFVADGRNSYWSLCVTVASAAGALPDALKAPERRTGTRTETNTSPSRVDYKTILNEQEFALYADLRTWRKSMAEAEGVPVYTVFTNEQLAEIVRRRTDTLAALGEIDGIGPARLERYGASVLVQLQTKPPTSSAE